MNHLIQLLLKPLNAIDNIRRSADIQDGNDEFDFEMLNFGAWLCPAGHCTLWLRMAVRENILLFSQSHLLYVILPLAKYHVLNFVQNIHFSVCRNMLWKTFSGSICKNQIHIAHIVLKRFLKDYSAHLKIPTIQVNTHRPSKQFCQFTVFNLSSTFNKVIQLRMTINKENLWKFHLHAYYIQFWEIY